MNAEERILKSKADTALDKWRVSLADKSKGAVSSNFDRLFMRLAKLKVPYEMARTIADKAVELHYPKQYVIKTVFKAMKSFPGTIVEFEESWKSMIEEKGLESFHAFFSEEDEDEPAMIGSMSIQEYTKQRKYANSFQTFDWTKSRDQIKENLSGFDDLIEDIDLDDRGTNE